MSSVLFIRFLRLSLFPQLVEKLFTIFDERNLSNTSSTKLASTRVHIRRTVILLLYIYIPFKLCYLPPPHPHPCSLIPSPLRARCLQMNPMSSQITKKRGKIERVHGTPQIRVLFNSKVFSFKVSPYSPHFPLWGHLTRFPRVRYDTFSPLNPPYTEGSISPRF